MTWKAVVLVCMAALAMPYLTKCLISEILEIIIHLSATEIVPQSIQGRFYIASLFNYKNYNCYFILFCITILPLWSRLGTQLHRKY